jgi:hypothetical protein
MYKILLFNIKFANKNWFLSASLDFSAHTKSKLNSPMLFVNPSTGTNRRGEKVPGLSDL